MNKLGYLFEMATKQMVCAIKTNKAVFLSFYLGMILPLFCMGNLTFLENQLSYFRLDNMENCQNISWSSSFVSEEQRNDLVSSIDGNSIKYNVMKELRIAQLNNDSFYVGSNAQLEGKIEQESICTVGKNIADKYKLKVNQKISIENKQFIIQEIIHDVRYADYVLVPMKDFEGLAEGELFVQHEIVVERRTKEYANSEDEIRGWFQNQQISLNSLEIMNSGQYYQSVKDTKQSWAFARIVVGVSGMLFALINILVVLIGKIQEYRKTYAIKLALGMKSVDLYISFFVENVLLAFLADLLLLATFPFMAKMMDMDHVIIIDFKIIVGLFGITIGICGVISLLLIRYIKKIQIAAILQGEK